MEHLQKLRECIEDNSGAFSDGEYLKYMNLLLGVSKRFMDDEEEDDDGDYLHMPLSVGEYLSLWGTNSSSSHTSTADDGKILEIINWFYEVMDLAGEYSTWFNYFFCLHAYLFQNYQFLQANLQFAQVIRGDLVSVLAEDSSDYPLSPEQLQIMVSWSEILERDFGQPKNALDP